MQYVSYGRIEEFLLAQDDWITYTERLSHYFEANSITDANNKKGSATLSVWNGNILLIKRPHHTR